MSYAVGDSPDNLRYPDIFVILIGKDIITLSDFSTPHAKDLILT